MEELQRRVDRLEDAVRKIQAALVERDREIDRLRRLVGDSQPVEADGNAPAARVWRALEGLMRDAPDRLNRSLESVAREISALVAREDEATLERLATNLVPEVIELCQDSRRSGDTGELFYETLEDRFEEMMEACELEPIAPEPGEAYQNSLHNAVRVVRTGEPAKRDTVELCLSRGFRWRGRLLRKAEVSVYL